MSKDTGAFMSLYNNRPSDLAPTQLTENALTTLKARYLARDEKGVTTETPEDLFWRVASKLASAETNKKDQMAYARKFYEGMVKGYFMPNSPTLMNAGRSTGMLSACFVLPLEDSIDQIFETVKNTAIIQKAGGGTGFSFDRLRPTGDYISSSGGTTSGPISFWRALSEATNAIQQGSWRRGANMGMMTITHPDILKFITAKQDLTAFTNYNISIKITDAWMKLYKEDKNGPHTVINPRNSKSYFIPKSKPIKEYDMSHLIPVEDWDGVTSVWLMSEVYGIIIDCAWKTGEPGLFFIDKVNEGNMSPNVGDIEASNPCGEVPLLPYEACNLASINVHKFIERDAGGLASFNWEVFKEVIHTTTRMLDNVIEVNKYPIPKIDEVCRGNRKIGLGVMGFADTLFELRLSYCSADGVAFGERIAKFLNDESHEASHLLAVERGSFLYWKGSRWDTEKHTPMRNVATTTVAPTGTISIFTDSSGGIEPMFSLAFERNVLGGKKMLEANKVFSRVAKERGIYTEELMRRIITEGTLAHIDGIPEDIRKVFVSTHDISPEWHTRMQAAFQKHGDNSVSKTVNLPHDATREDVEESYRLAWELGCKGVTVYRDGCRSEQPMALKKAVVATPTAVEVTKKRSVEEFKPRRPLKTAPILSAIRIRQNTPFGHMHVTVSIDPVSRREVEVFAQLGKAGDVSSSDLEAISRMVSMFLRMGGNLQDVISQFEGIGSHMSVATKDGSVKSLADGMSKALKIYHLAKSTHGLDALLLGRVDISKISLKGEGSLKVAEPKSLPTEEKVSKSDAHQAAYKVKCTECGGTLSFQEGCIKCPSCGFSKCS